MALQETDNKRTGDESEEISTDVESTEAQKLKLKYPRSIPFIIGNEFCERFNYYGMRTILVLYLVRILNYKENDATVIFHTFTMLVYFLCVFGAIIADSWLGKFKTILYLSIVYVCGSIIISLGAIPPLNLPGVEMTIIGLVLIAMGSGGIKPCVAAFGGDQFKLPEQTKQMAKFFSLFYFAINSGSLISTTITPILRENVQCFNQSTCFSLAFGVPAVLMCISVVIFMIGRPMYISKPPAGNMVLLVAKTIGNAIVTKCKSYKTITKNHWLDYAEQKYDKGLIADVKVLLRILVLYIPLPVFWALFDQQGSRWTFQASRMDGVLGSIDIKPDQLQLINPLLILLFIPLYEAFFYPLLAKIGISRPLQKLFCGGILAGIAFTVSGIVELQLQKTYPVLPEAHQCEFRFFNGIPNCDYQINVKTMQDEPIDKFDLKGLSSYKMSFLDADKMDEVKWEMKASKDCDVNQHGKIALPKGKAFSFFLKRQSAEDNKLLLDGYIDYTNKPNNGNPELRVLANLLKPDKIIFKDTKGDNTVRYTHEHTFRDLTEIPTSTYDVYVGDELVISDLQIQQGAIYTILIGQKTSDKKFDSEVITITEPNSLHILWLVPQYFIMTLGEVMFSVTGLEFSYSQAPSSMKSVLQACWLLTVAIGNAIVVIIAEAKIFNSQASEFFLFAGLMFIDMLLFAGLAYRYQPNNPSHDSDSALTAPIDEPQKDTNNSKENQAFEAAD